MPKDPSRNSIASGTRTKAFCKVCTKTVSNADTGLQCDDCEDWVHAKCVDINDSVYAYFKHSDHPFFCKICQPAVVVKLQTVAALQQSILDHDKVLAEVFDRLKALENQNARPDCGNFPLQMDFNKAMEYAITQDKKKSSAVVVNLPEVCDAKTAIQGIAKAGNFDNNLITDVFRYPVKARMDAADKPRIIKVKFANAHSKSEFMDIFKKQKFGNEYFKKTIIRNDLMPDELARDRELRKQIKTCIANDNSVYYFIKDGKVVSRPHRRNTDIVDNGGNKWNF
jgi:PHD-finger/Phorbol esters/diacylglycerol binding domain (C1 domain)